MNLRRATGLVGSALTIVGCSTSTPADRDGGTDDAGSSSGTTTTHVTPPLPSVPFHGGHVIAHMKLVTITFAGYPFQDQIQAFGDWLVGSAWLASVGQEYGVGAGTHIAKLVVDYTPPAIVSTQDIETYIAAGINDGVFPQPDADTIYVIYYPQTTSPAGLGCEGAWWGHNTVRSPVRFAYAAIPACPPPAIYGWSQVQSIEQDASHEIIETATDPDPLSPSYEITDTSDPFYYMGTEIADLCVGVTTSEAGFLAQRIWSNSAAGAGHSPCVPAPAGDAFFGVSPTSSAALSIAAGGEAQVPVKAWADGARGSWNIAAAPFPGYAASLAPTGTLDRDSVSEGDTATLTVHVPADAQSGSRGILVIDSLTADANGVATSGPYEWPVLVQVP